MLLRENTFFFSLTTYHPSKTTKVKPMKGQMPARAAAADWLADSSEVKEKPARAAKQRHK
jgi:hypothetical protein